MKKLTTEEELDILNVALNKNEYLDNGSSRIVCELSDGKVLKIAVDEGGIVQNNREIETFEEFGNQFLAEIFAYGKYVIVMERLDYATRIEDIFRYQHSAQTQFDKECCGWGAEYDEEQFESALVTQYELGEILGESEDNDQLGMRVGTKQVVSYDYGFCEDEEGTNISDNLRSLINFNKLDLTKIIGMVKELLSK